MLSQEVFYVTVIFHTIVFSRVQSLSGQAGAVCHDEVPYIKDRWVTRKVYHIIPNCDYRYVSTCEEYLTENVYEPFTAYKKEEVCCPGYTNYQDSGQCIPICDTKCTNGFCAKPNTCVCNSGYELLQNICIPICRNTCVHGTCVGPNTCTCNLGYTLKPVKYTCEPQCSSGCKNGWCEKPNICACHPGYKRTNDNKCVPVCEKNCVNGRCVHPNVCVCTNGFQLSQNDSFLCEPACSESCVNGICTAPNKCTCNEGYKLASNYFTCEPICLSSCDHGWCIEPNICGCNTGYERSDDNECLPMCRQSCKNGKCVEPDICACDDGFKESLIDAFTCEPRCSEPCKFGVCTDPEVCTCHDGYRLGADNYTCEPICTTLCENGYCAQPDVCGCNFGYRMSESKKCDPVCERPCLNGTCVGPDTCACDEGFQQSDYDDFTCDPVCNNCVNGTCVAPNECACDDDFVNDESDIGACIPICDPKCIHGGCAVGGCNCSYGWKGDFCDQPLLCILNQSLLAVSTEVVNTYADNELPEFGRADYATENSLSKWDWSVCRSECLAQLNTTIVNFTEFSADAVLYFIPIDTPCNIVMAHSSAGSIQKNAALVIAGSVIGLFLIIILVGYVVIKKMKRGSYKIGEQRLLFSTSQNNEDALDSLL